MVYVLVYLLNDLDLFESFCSLVDLLSMSHEWLTKVEVGVNLMFLSTETSNFPIGMSQHSKEEDRAMN